MIGITLDIVERACKEDIDSDTVDDLPGEGVLKKYLFDHIILHIHDYFVSFWQLLFSQCFI